MLVIDKLEYVEELKKDIEDLKEDLESVEHEIRIFSKLDSLELRAMFDEKLDNENNCVAGIRPSYIHKTLNADLYDELLYNFACEISIYDIDEYRELVFQRNVIRDRIKRIEKEIERTLNGN